MATRIQRPIMIAVALLALAAVALCWAVVARGSAGPAIAGDFSEDRIDMPDITLTDHNGALRPLRGELTAGRLVVVNFNYTTCESICPIGNDIMAMLDNDPDLAAAPEVRLLSITIDPAHDTPALLNRVAESFAASDRWVWLTGDPNDIDRLLDSVGASFADITLHDPIFLIGDVQTGRFYRSLTLPGAAELQDLTRRLAG